MVVGALGDNIRFNRHGSFHPPCAHGCSASDRGHPGRARCHRCCTVSGKNLVRDDLHSCRRHPPSRLARPRPTCLPAGDVLARVSCHLRLAIRTRPNDCSRRGWIFRLEWRQVSCEHDPPQRQISAIHSRHLRAWWRSHYHLDPLPSTVDRRSCAFTRNWLRRNLRTPIRRNEPPRCALLCPIAVFRCTYLHHSRHSLHHTHRVPSKAHYQRSLSSLVLCRVRWRPGDCRDRDRTSPT